MKMTKANEDAIADVIAEAVRHHVAARLGPIVDLVNAQQARIKELEQRPPSGIRYCGVYRPGETYQRGDFVTWGNQMWHAWETTHCKPGESRDWQLAVRKGADGRDGKCVCKDAE